MTKTTMVALSEGSLSNSNVHGAFPNLSLGFISVNNRPYFSIILASRKARQHILFCPFLTLFEPINFKLCYKHNYMDTILHIIHNSFDDSAIVAVLTVAKTLTQVFVWMLLCRCF